MPRILPLALLLAASSAWSAPPRLDIPAFAELRNKAVESTELTFGPITLGFVRWLARHDEDNEDVALLKGMKRVVIRHYEFASDYPLPKSPLEALRRSSRPPAGHE